MDTQVVDEEAHMIGFASAAENHLCTLPIAHSQQVRKHVLSPSMHSLQHLPWLFPHHISFSIGVASIHPGLPSRLVACSFCYRFHSMGPQPSHRVMRFIVASGPPELNHILTLETMVASKSIQIATFALSCIMTS